MDERDALRFSIWDPTGNLTALVESPVAPARQPAAAAALMRRHPEVEQVGFVDFPAVPDEDGVQVQLRMAGGEFCGNAAMSTAALWQLRTAPREESGTVLVRVSGAREPVAVRLRREDADRFGASVRMPAPRAIRETDVAFEGLSGCLPLVSMEGISHLLIERASVFYSLLRDRAAAGRAVRSWCGTLRAEGLGLMFLEGDGERRRLTPLVYIPGSGTEFWESSCASRRSAVGMTLAARLGTALRLELCEPGGTLCVESAPDGGETWLGGTTRLLAELTQ